jgi:hypothetical protein
MKIWQELLIKNNNNQATDELDMMSTTRAIMARSEDTLLQIFNDHKMELLDKDADYIIYSVCRSNGNGPLTKEQMDIHDKINPAINKIYDLLEIKNLSREQQQTILFIIRFMMALEMLFMMEFFKNKRNQELEHKKNMLEEMKTIGHA